MDTRIEKEAILPPATARFPDTKMVKMLPRSSGFCTRTPVPNKGATRMRDRFRTRNTAMSLIPLVNNLFERRASATAYLERWTFEIMNPVMNMNDEVKNQIGRAHV